MDLITIAYLEQAHGLNGYLKTEIISDFPDLRFKPGQRFLIKDGADFIELTLKEARINKKEALISFFEINDRDAAERHAKKELYMRKEDAPLPDGYYRLEDLKGLNVYNEQNEFLGQVTNVYSNSPVKNLKVEKTGAKPFYVPFLFDEFIISLDQEKKIIIIKDIEGLR